MASGDIASACWMVGSEAATTWMSRIAMNIPTHIRTKPNHVATRACVVLQTGVVLVVDADFSILWNGDLLDGDGPRRNSRPRRGCTPSPHRDERPPAKGSHSG